MLIRILKLLEETMEKIKNKKASSRAQIEREETLLTSLRIVINVLYALLIFQVFLILPRPDDPELEYLTLEQIYMENVSVILVIVVGLALITIYWLQFNKQIGNLARSSPVHAALCLVQMIFLMLYMYFVRFDIEFDGMTLALRMESILLALAGFTGAFNWYYAYKNGLISKEIDDEENRNIFFSILPEPFASLISLPFAVYGPEIWSLSFLSFIPLTFLFTRIKNRKKNRALQENQIQHE